MNAGPGGVSGRVVDVVEALGELGVGLLILAETVVPPVPSELVLGFAGFSAAQGVISGPLAWVAATVGSLVGAYLLYALGAVVGQERLHELAGKRWFLLFNQRDLRRGEDFFDRHGGKVVLLGRMVPLIRSVVSVPAGVTRMPLGRFTVLTAIGSGIWNALFLFAGFQLAGRYEDLAGYTRPVSLIVAGLVLLTLVALLVRGIRRHRAG